MVLLVIGGEELGIRDTFCVLYFYPSVFDKSMSFALYTAIVMDIVVRSFSLSLKIAINIMIPLLRNKMICRNCCALSDGRIIYLLI